METDDEVEVSTISGPIRHGGVEVRRRICRFAAPGEQWPSDVVDPNGASTSRADLFDTGETAFEAFLGVIRETGSRSFVVPAVMRH